MKGAPNSTVMIERLAECDLDGDQLATLASVPPARVNEILAGEQPTIAELHALSRALGVDLVTYDPDTDTEPERLPEVLTLLKASEDYLPLEHWPQVLDAAEVARTLTQIEAWRGLASRFDELVNAHQPDGVYAEPREWRNRARRAGAATPSGSLGRAS